MWCEFNVLSVKECIFYVQTFLFNESQLHILSDREHLIKHMLLTYYEWGFKNNFRNNDNIMLF